MFDVPSKLTNENRERSSVMNDINWHFIINGEIFERLVADLVVNEDPDAHPFFARKGKDGGQDILSSDKTLVYQAKYRRNNSASQAIAAAKEEAKKIKKYRTAGHPREPQWCRVTHWRLVTNAAFNLTDHQKWQEDIVPLFEKLKLKADYWCQAELGVFLKKYFHILHNYFGNTTQAFILGHRIKDKLLQHEAFIKKDELTPFVGRKKEIEQIESFLNSPSQQFLIIHGAVGVGKTRVAVEACQCFVKHKKGWQILWANIATMEVHNKWFEGINREHSTLIVVNAPNNDKVLRILEEQLGNYRTSKWKILITVCSKEHPALKFLKMKSSVDYLAINALAKEDGELLCMKLISTGPLAHKDDHWKSSASEKIAKRYAYQPIWIMLAVHHLESKGDLKQVLNSVKALAEPYLLDIENNQDNLTQKQVRDLLRWVALLGSIDRDDGMVIQMLTDKTELSSPEFVKGALFQLATQKVLVQRGRFNRLIEIKPDVLRDHLLIEWLSTNNGYGEKPIEPSEYALSLTHDLLQTIQNDHLDNINRSILSSLVRTELHLKLSGKPVDLLRNLINELLADIGDKSPNQHIHIAEIFIEFASLRPKDTLKMSQTLRTSRSNYKDESNGVLFALARPLFCAAKGAQGSDEQVEILTELCNIAEEEAKIAQQEKHKLPNDGNRAKDYISHIISGGPQFYSQFEEATSIVGQRLLGKVDKTILSSAEEEVLDSILTPSLSRERVHRLYIQPHMQVTKLAIDPSHPAWKTLVTLKTKIKSLLENDATPRTNRVVLWPFFVHALRSMAQYGWGQETQDDSSQVRDEIIEDFEWVGTIIKRRRDDNDFIEISAAKVLWHRYDIYKEDTDLYNELKSLNNLYKTNPIVKEFEDLSSQDMSKKNQNSVKEKAISLANKDQAEIETFLKRANIFFNSDQGICQVFNVATQLGLQAESYHEVQKFIRESLKEEAVTPRTQFAAFAANGWVSNLRENHSAITHTCLDELLVGCGSNEQKMYLLMRVYGDFPIYNQFINKVSDGEYHFIRLQESLFVIEKRYADFIACITWGFDFEWDNLTTILERVLDAVPHDQMSIALEKLITNLLYSFKCRESQKQKIDIPDKLNVWMMDQLIRIPNLDDCEKFQWHIKEVLNIAGLMPLSWLAKALKTRIEKEKKQGYKKMYAFSHHIHLSKFVAPITEKQKITCDLVGVVNNILDLISRGSVSSYLDNVLRQIDPYGRVVPDEVAKRFTNESNKQKKFILANICGGLTEDRELWRYFSKTSETVYSVGSEAWRTIARPVLSYALHVTIGDMKELYRAINDDRISSWPVTPGEVPKVFVDAVQSAKDFLNNEPDAVFIPFWEWRLHLAQNELEEQEEEAKEEQSA